MEVEYAAYLSRSDILSPSGCGKSEVPAFGLLSCHTAASSNLCTTIQFAVVSVAAVDLRRCESRCESRCERRCEMATAPRSTKVVGTCKLRCAQGIIGGWSQSRLIIAEAGTPLLLLLLQSRPEVPVC